MADHYVLLGLDYSASVRDIKKAYRHKALLHHPDKNPEDATAADLFQLVQKAYDTLSDPVAKLEYDKQIQAKLERQRQELAMNRDRLLAKQQLELRERQAHKRRHDDRVGSAGLDRLKEEGLRYQQELEKELALSAAHTSKRAHLSDETSTSTAIEVRWKKKVPMTKEDLQLILGKYGHIESIVVSDKKHKALVEFSSRANVDRLLSYSVSVPHLKVFTIKVIDELDIQDGNMATEEVVGSSGMTYEQQVLFKMQQFAQNGGKNHE